MARTKLLIADDEEGIRSLIRMTLTADSYDILEASDGDEALEMAREHLPQLLFLDVRMPRRSGFEVCRILKEDTRTSSITIVMLTAQAQDSNREEGEAAGADGYFTKPFSPMALLETVDSVLSARG
ncbi:MAG: response regulator [Actinomycetota bacterium]